MSFQGRGWRRMRPTVSSKKVLDGKMIMIIIYICVYHTPHECGFKRKGVINHEAF